MSNESITLNGGTYFKFPLSDEFYPEEGICIDTDVSFPKWTQTYSAQIIGNFDDQGYGLFYQNGIEEVRDFVITDCGNNHILQLNHRGQIISQRDLPNKETANITAKSIDQFGNRYFYDGNSNVVMRFDSSNVLKSQFSLNGSTFDVKVIHSNSIGNVFFLNNAESKILEYTPTGTYITEYILSNTAHNNFVIKRDDSIKTFYSIDGTPMLVDSNGSYYNLTGIYLYKNGNPFFFIGPKTNTFGIDSFDNIWIAYDDNRMLKLNNKGKILFNKEFHNIVPCKAIGGSGERDKINISFTRELHREGYREFAWVLLKNSKYALKLNTEGNIVGCVPLTNLLDTTRFPDTDYERFDPCTFGDFTSYKHQKTFGVAKINSTDSYIIARIAITDGCDGSVIIKTLSHNVSDLTGENNIQFCYDGYSGNGSLSINGEVVDSFIQKGRIYYIEGSRRPTMIGANSGLFRAKKEELELDDPIYLIGSINNLVVTKGGPESIKSTRNFNNPISLEFDTNYTKSYCEKIDKFFMFRPTGFKSPKVNLNIRNSGFKSEENQKAISEDLVNIVETEGPVQTEINVITWDESDGLKSLIT